MTIVINNESIEASFSAASSPSEIRAGDGRLLGRFIPASNVVSFPEFGMTDQELDIRDNDPNARWFTSDEVMAKIRELTKRS